MRRALAALALAATLATPALAAEEAVLTRPGQVAEVIDGEARLIARYRVTAGGLDVDLVLSTGAEAPIATRIRLADGQSHGLSLAAEDDAPAIHFTLLRSGAEVLLTAAPPLATAGTISY